MSQVPQEDIDPNNLPVFQIPDQFLEQLFEMTGGAEHGKGFIMAYSAPDGRALIYSRCGTQIVEMGLRKALEKFLNEMEQAEDTLGFSSSDEE